MNRAQLVVAVARRAGISTNDGLFDEVNDRLNEALLEMNDANQQGWDWLWRDVALTTTPDVGAYTFATLGLLVADNAALLAANPDDTNLYPIAAIKEVDLLTVSGARQPLQRISRREMNDGLYPGGGWWPAAWTVENATLLVAPPSTDAIDVQLRVLIAERPLVVPAAAADEPSPLLPARFHPTLINLARALCYEMKQDDDRAAAARTIYERQLPAMRASARPYRGPGRPTLEQV